MEGCIALGVSGVDICAAAEQKLHHLNLPQISCYDVESRVAICVGDGHVGTMRNKGIEQGGVDGLAVQGPES
ncbi:uncharacterized protein ACHE_80095A [Aspergillus chevalieri]|uniref:Uncharacterized protein n=1 Tax=Aspergillus chevalieri TaxID=182096 RepID=A0A7R7ZRK9_ASPCH|nr:uncharacterized protein ACHE_80095A [Aspergillus chevalieri]BCR92195.1 hypothetical protein ACHE_80095A [Aspergillus chevalieri]